MRFLLGTFPTIAAICGLGFFLLVMRSARFDREHGYPNSIRPNEVHHAYVGALLILASYWPGILPPLLRWVGAVFVWDDAYEHTMQLGGQFGYKTALHRLADASIFKLKPVTWLLAKLDRLGHKIGGTPTPALLLVVLCATWPLACSTRSLPPAAHEDSTAAVPADSGHGTHGDQDKHKGKGKDREHDKDHGHAP